jgi:hypothetical protein
VSTKLALLVVLAVLVFALVWTTATRSERIPAKRTVAYGVVRFNGLGPERWAQRWRQEHRRVVELGRQLEQKRRTLLTRPSVIEAITVVFGRHASEAIRVVDCETGHTFDTGARNGQYLGLFQMGSSERALYGHGPTALEQARAAYVYFVVSGRSWSPWECKP